MAADSWSVHDAKQQFSRVLRAATEHGPQFVSRHGSEVAVVLDIGTYRRLSGTDDDFKALLLKGGPDWSSLDLTRDDSLPRETEFDRLADFPDGP